VKLKAAAKYFDDTPVFEGYTGEYLWPCQFSSFNDANAVGSTSTRRILSIAPGLEIPVRRAIKVFDDVWLVGDGNPDSWKGSVIRQSFNMKKATSLAALLTPSEACLAAAGVNAYTQQIYFKDTVNSLNNAEYDPFWNFFLAPVETVEKGYFIRSGGKLHRVRSAYLPLEDLRIAQSDEVDAGPLDATFATGAYVPATDSYAAGSVATKVILLDCSKLYENQTKASTSVAKGDMSALVPKSALTPAVGKTVSVQSATWKILSVDSELDCWLLHLRKP
jgi:hypothetical protein